MYIIVIINMSKFYNQIVCIAQRIMEMENLTILEDEQAGVVNRMKNCMSEDFKRKKKNSFNEK